MTIIQAIRLFAIVVASIGMAAVFCWAAAQVVRFILAARDERKLDRQLRESLRAPRAPHLVLRDSSKARPAIEREHGPYYKPWNQGGGGMDGAA